MTESENDLTTDIVELDELLPWIEFGCWTAIALLPFLYWVNGPAVSTDQYVMRNILLAVSVIGAFGLRYWNWRSKERSATHGPAKPSDNTAATDADVPETLK